MNKLVVVGSSNTDMTVKTPRFPEPGETILGGRFFMFPGGKGANQAVAAARFGAEVTFVCSLGDDLFGRKALEGYRSEGIHTDHIRIHADAPSGVALITVNPEGENEIVVAPGANDLLLVKDLQHIAGVVESADMVLAQLEIPLDSVLFLMRFCMEKRIPLILNPAPARELPEGALDGLYMITPNQTETNLLTGMRADNEAEASRASAVLRDRGVQNVIITLGKSGAYYSGSAGQGLVEATKVRAVDSTAAGDVFNGILAASLAKGLSVREAAELATKGAALSVTRLGAQNSAPFLNEINT